MQKHGTRSNAQPRTTQQHHIKAETQPLHITMALLGQAAMRSLRNRPTAVIDQLFRRRTISPAVSEITVKLGHIDGVTRSHSSSKKYSSNLHAIEMTNALNNHHFIQQTRSMVMVTVTQSSKEDELTQQTSNAAGAAVIESTSTHNNNVDDLTITASCVARIKQLASQRQNPQSIYLRLYVDAGGCSGFQYKFLLLSEDETSDDDEEDGAIDPEEDIVYSIDGARLVIDQTSLELLRGSTIDYVQEMIRSSFAVVNNPNSESACGCGSSFAVKKFQANPALD